MSTPVIQSEPHESAVQARMAEYFFVCPQYQRLFDLLQHLAENTNQVLLLQGERGAGKTTLVYRIQSEAPDHWTLCRVDANPMMRPDQLLAGLARCLSAPVDEEQGQRVLLAAFSACRLRGKLPVVVVDDAAQMSVGLLMTLFRLHESADDGLPPFALLLLAEPSIAEVLETPQIKAMGTSKIKRMDYPALETEQIEAYIGHYLRMEGLENTLRLSPRQLQEVQRQSDGLPGRVNEWVVQALKDGIETDTPGLRDRLRMLLPNIPPLTAMAVGGVIAIILATLVFQKQINALFETDSAALETAPLGPPQVVDTLLLKPLPLPTPVPQPAERRQPPEATPPAVQADPEDIEQGLISEPLYLPPTRGQVSQQSSSPAAAALDPTPVKQTPKSPAMPAQQPPERPEMPAQQPPEPPAVQVSQTAKPIPAPLAKLGEPASAPAQPAAKPAAKAPTLEKHGDRASPEQAVAWLRQQKPTRYTLQILGVSNEQAAIKFIRERKFQARVVYYRTTRNGKPWYSVLHGIYPNRQAALAASADLPDDLRRIGAWPRSLAKVQDELIRH